MRAVVTGASSGIGAAVSRRLLESGATVFGLSRRAAAFDGAYTAVGVDLADPEARAATFTRMAAEAGPIDLVVNNAGATAWASPTEIDTAAWRSLFELNFWAPVELTRALLPTLAPGALVINVTSVTAHHLPAASFAPYAVTKSALAETTAALRLDLASRGVRLCELAPGLVETPIYATVPGFAKVEASLRSKVPRWLSPDDVADVVEWLISRPAHVDVASIAVLPVGQGR